MFSEYFPIGFFPKYWIRGVGLWWLTPNLNKISAISWRSVLLVEETWVPGKKHRLAVSHWPTLSQYYESKPHLSKTYLTLNYNSFTITIFLNWYFYTDIIAINRLGRNKKKTMSEKCPMQKREKIGKINTTSTYIHVRAVSWLGTGTSIKCDGDKLVIWDGINCVMHVIMITPLVSSNVSDNKNNI